MSKSQTGYDRIADIKRLQFIIDNLSKSIPTDGLVLDVGCGNGIISRNLGSEGYKVKGIDVSEDAIRTAIKNNKLENVSFEVINAENNSYPKNTYDSIVCSEVLEHLNDPSELLQKLHLSLKPQGILIVTVPNGMGPREVLVTKPVQKMYRQKGTSYKVMTKFKKIFGYSGTTVQSDADNLDHIQFFSKSDVTTLANKNQFKIEQIQNSNFMDDVFPFSLITRKIKLFQKIDSKIANVLPNSFTGGFLMIWKKL